MEQKKKASLFFTLKLILPLLIVIFLFIGGVSTGVITFEQPEKNVDMKTINATIIIDFEEGKTYTKNMVIYNLTIFDFLLEIQKIGDIQLEIPYNKQIGGYEIKSITYQEKKYTHGEDGYWWLFYINNQFATAGADKIYVNNNDIIKWKYEKF